MTTSNKPVTYSSSGGRKTSTARVHLKNSGQTKILINGLEPIKYLEQEILVQDMLLPLKVTNTLESFEINIKVEGGGRTGQSGAARLALSNALVKVSEDYRVLLRQFGLLTRDARKKERKKYGLKAARKAPQFSKR
ncbi:30S ribosomal protein S9 [Spiroplasma sp. AdecLV25b]|uniref:30S ribosomal protein S9 n=1 Tax=Spiroplasma sp. AdecLV25b TaxID=3027162 RepID=UPI0027E02B06|nr:30S ribosomal protein S9 [Spiroplasma sp. AdecLV25b]